MVREVRELGENTKRERKYNIEKVNKIYTRR
jgi:hypothetical protein